MIRRGLFAVAFASMAGCGLIQSVKPALQPLRPGAVSRTFDAPVGSVVRAAMEATGVEIDLDEEVDFDLSVESIHWARDERGAFKPVGDPAENTFEVDEIIYGVGGWTGQTKDGRRATIWFRPLDDRKRAEATVLIGRHGDPELSRAFLDRIANCLAHPADPAKGNRTRTKGSAQLPTGATPDDVPMLDQKGPGR